MHPARRPVLPAFLALVCAATCGDDHPPGAPDAAARPDAAPPDAAGPETTYDRSQIQLVAEDTITDGGMQYRRGFYRNAAYRCGRSGQFSFVVLEPLAIVGQPATLWVTLHGGGAGYYDSTGAYHPSADDSQNLENTAEQLTAVALRLGRAGDRVVALSMCDHDLYAGIGQVYPGNPHVPDDRVEGLIASLAAVHFVVRGNQALPGYATGLVFVRGSSAGSAGAYHVSAALARAGILVNGAVLDSYVLTTRHPELFAARCTPLNRDPDFDLAELMRKLGPYANDPTLLLENNVGGPFAVPFLFLEGTLDGQCCGDEPPLAGATAAGFANNCRYIYDILAQAMTAAPDPLRRLVMLEGAGHVVGDTPDGQAAIDAWVAAVLAAAPVAPVFPP